MREGKQKTRPPHDLDLHPCISCQVCFTMGVLSDLYLSTPDLAAGYGENLEVPAGERAEFKRLTFLEFSMLWAIMEGVPWEEDRHMDVFEMVASRDDGGEMIFRFPEEFIATASTVEPAHAAAAAEAWSQTEELACTAGDIRPAIDELIRLARLALQSGKSVYLWNCV
jgi:hypothetical protein